MKLISVQKRKFNDLARDLSEAYLVSEDEEKIVLFSPPGMAGYHYAKQQRTTCPDGTLEIYFKNRFCNVWHVCDQRSGTTRIYANVAMPVLGSIGVIHCAALPGPMARLGFDWIDLDLDMRVTPDGEVEMLDEAEFEINIETMPYPRLIVESARNSWRRLEREALSDVFPFNHRHQVEIYREIARASGLGSDADGSGLP